MKLLNDVIHLLRESKKQLDSNLLSNLDFRETQTASSIHARSTDAQEPVVSRPFAASARMNLLDRREIRLFSQLRKAFSDSIFVWPKPRLSDVLAIRSSESFSAAFELHNKHLGFLLCRQADMKPLLAIRFGSDTKPNDEALSNIGLSIVRFDSPEEFSLSQVRRQLADITNCDKP